jgi:hypothetical protein
MFPILFAIIIQLHMSLKNVTNLARSDTKKKVCKENLLGTRDS